MNEDRCVCCGEIVPEGRQICLNCEHRMAKVGAILQSRNATEEEVNRAYRYLQADSDAESVGETLKTIAMRLQGED